MRLAPHAFTLLFALAIIGAAIGNAQQTAAPLVNGMQAVTLTRTPTPGATKPEFTSVTFFPGRAMLIQQITANFPGKGEVNVLAAPLGDLTDAAKVLNEKDSPNGDLAYRLGAAFLFPYPNRIRGKLSADGATLTTEWQGHTITLPANNIGSKPGAERHAMHGLILKTKVDSLEVHQTSERRRLQRPLALEDRPGDYHRAHRRGRRRHNCGSQCGCGCGAGGNCLASVFQPSQWRPQTSPH
jgi:hypothetical protein